MAFDALQHAVMFNNRERRRDRYARTGLATAAADFLIEPGGGIPNPLSGGAELKPATLVMRMESFGGSLSGRLLATGATTDGVILAGNASNQLFLLVKVAGIIEVNTGFVPVDINLASGFHTYVVACDPVPGHFKLYVDGRLVIDATDVDATLWSDPTEVWEYGDGTANLGGTEPLEVHLNKLPAIF